VFAVTVGGRLVLRSAKPLSAVRFRLAPPESRDPDGFCHPKVTEKPKSLPKAWELLTDWVHNVCLLLRQALNSQSLTTLGNNAAASTANGVRVALLMAIGASDF
jgi:hypothetical protein